MKKCPSCGKIYDDTSSLCTSFSCPPVELVNIKPDQGASLGESIGQKVGNPIKNKINAKFHWEWVVVVILIFLVLILKNDPSRYLNGVRIPDGCYKVCNHDGYCQPNYWCPHRYPRY